MPASAPAVDPAAKMRMDVVDETSGSEQEQHVQSINSDNTQEAVAAADVVQNSSGLTQEQLLQVIRDQHRVLHDQVLAVLPQTDSECCI